MARTCRTARKSTGRLPVGQLAPRNVPQPQESQPDIPREATSEEEPFEIELVVPESPTAQDSPATPPAPPSPYKSPREPPEHLTPHRASLFSSSAPEHPPHRVSRPPPRRRDARPPHRRSRPGEPPTEFPASHSPSPTPWPASVDTGAAGGRNSGEPVPPSTAGPPWTEVPVVHGPVDPVYGISLRN
jgi:hypothetical protein